VVPSGECDTGNRACQIDPDWVVSTATEILRSAMI
jgi:hypothetical protein